MKRSLLLFLSLSTLASVEARADVVSDRVFLTTGTSTCGTGSLGFRRIKHLPDGSQSAETSEFQVPYGSYLEITSIEYTTPYYTPWAKWYQQSIDFNIRQRNGVSGTNIFAARYDNKQIYAMDEHDNYVGIGEAVSSGAHTHVATFPVGPLMSSAARLCVTVGSNFWLYGGNIRVRGRLIASGEPPMMTTDPILMK